MQDEPSRKDIFDQGMTMLSAAYNRKFDTNQMDVYWLVLGSLDSSRMFAAFEAALRSEKYLPTPATIRGYAKEARSEWTHGDHIQHMTPEQLDEVRADIDALKKRTAERMSADYTRKDSLR